MTALETEIFNTKLIQFLAEYALRYGTSEVPPSIAVRLAAPGMEMFFDLSVPHTVHPPLPGGPIGD